MKTRSPSSVEIPSLVGLFLDRSLLRMLRNNFLGQQKRVCSGAPGAVAASAK